MEVLRLIADGLSDKQVARALGISDLTVRKHRSHLLKKLGVTNVCALLFEAINAGWLEVTEMPSE
jgi:DNA-binding NarL/FixJ family response regulator